MNNNYSRLQLFSLFLISLILFLYTGITNGENEDAPDEQESEEFRNSLVRNVWEDYPKGFAELLNSIISINNTLLAVSTNLAAQDATIAKIELRLNNIYAKMASQDTKCSTMNAKIDAENVKLEALNTNIAAQGTLFSTLSAKLDDQNVGLNNLNDKLAAQENQFATLNAKMDDQNVECNALNATIAAQGTQYAILNEQFDNQQVTLVAMNTTIAAKDAELAVLMAKIDTQKGECNALNATIAAQDTQYANLAAQFDDQQVELVAINTTIAAKDAELAALKAKIDAQKIECSVLNSTVETLKKKTNEMLPIYLNTWECFDSLIRIQAKQITTGKSFNGSTLSDIKSRAAHIGHRRWYTAIVFVNHLDEAIRDFNIYTVYNASMYNPAPNSVSGLTQEVFTLEFPAKYYGAPHCSFSYVFPSLDIRIAAISIAGASGVGLAFVPKETDMQTYYNSKKGINGSFVYECCGPFIDRNLSVSYKNFFARMFADSEGNGQATLRIELTKLNLDE